MTVSRNRRWGHIPFHDEKGWITDLPANKTGDYDLRLQPTCVCVCACVLTYVCIYIHICKYVYMYICVYVYVYVNVYVYEYLYIVCMYV